MTIEEACEIITWIDEPELIAEPGQSMPAFSAEQIETARLVSAVATAWYSPSLNSGLAA